MAENESTDDDPRGARATSSGNGATGPKPSGAMGRGEGERTRLAPGLYVVATPIGNLGDITLRALETLKSADVIACEDTRVTGNMARRLDIQTPLTPYHEHNAESARPKLIDRIKNGGAVALVSDAGTPLVSDPGYKLVRAVVAEGLKVIPLPGASAALAALVVAGLPSDRFLFCGFPPQKTKARRDWLADVAGIGATLVIYEGPSRACRQPRPTWPRFSVQIGRPPSAVSLQNYTRKLGGERCRSLPSAMLPSPRLKGKWS